MSCRTRPTTRPWATCRTRWPRPTTPTTRARPSCCTSWPWRGKAISPWPTGSIAIATRCRSAALAHLALSFAAMDRKATAEEILGLLEKRNLDDTATRRDAARGTLPWSHSPAELRALYALAIEEVSPEVAQGQGTGRLAPGPSHRQPLGPGKGDRPRGAGLVPLVRRQPLHRRALQADRLRQRRAGQGAGCRSGRRQPVDRRAAEVPRQAGREGPPAGQLPDRRPRTLHLSVHPRRFRAGRQAQEHDRHWRVDALLRAGPAGTRRPRDPPRFRRAGRRVSDLPQSAGPASRRPPRHGEHRSLRGR